MTRRRGGGGGAAKPDRILRHHVECARNSYSTIEQLVNHLRSTYAYYSRDNLQTLTNRVSRIIRVSSRRNDTMVESNDDGGTPITKKRRKIDEEEKLRLVEAQHSDVLNHSGGGGGSISSVASASSSDENDLSDEEASTSMDAVYGKKIEPEFDLMKSMLREKLSQKSKKLGGGRGVTEAAELKDVKESALMKSMLREKKSKKSKKLQNGSDVKEVMELEVVDNKDMKEVHLMNKEGKLGDVWSKIEKETDNIGSSSSNEIDWPTFKYFGGMNGVINALKKQVILPFRYPHLVRRLGVEPITGILLHGPPGCGKTTLAYAIANETGVPFYKVSAPELVSGVSGASEENIRELFSKANRTAPSVVFIDEIDAIASKRENLRGMELRIVTQLLTCMDESSRLVQSDNNNVGSRSSYCRAGYVLVIGATNRPDALDPALRRPGRFEREFLLGVPDEYARVQILSTLTRNLKVEDAFDLVKIARSTPGFVGADLKALVKEAGIFAINRIIGDNVELSMEQKEPPVSDEVMENLSITMADFEEAVNVVQPSAKREGFSDIPNVKWDDVGGLHLLRQEFDRCIIRRVKFPEVYEDIGLDLETGFLLYGPPGCGKTLIAKAVANEAGTSFIHIKGPELLSKYVGESESAVRIIFSRARTCSPCIIFFDEVDALTTRRGREGGWIVERLLNQLLIELDGAEQRRGVYVIGATNRPEVMDPAVLRPGRLGKLLYVPLPSPDERGMILKTLARNKTIDANVDLMAIGKDSACESFSGADLSALMNEAVLAALEDNPFGRSSSSPWSVKDAHFKRALEKMSPSVSDEQIECYNLLLKNLKAA